MRAAGSIWGGGHSSRKRQQQQEYDHQYDMPPFLRSIFDRLGSPLSTPTSTTAPSAACISKSLKASTPKHAPIDADSAAEQRRLYLNFLNTTDDYPGLVAMLRADIQALLRKPLPAAAPLHVSVGDALFARHDALGSILTLGRHSRCDLKICDSATPYISRLQCIIIRTADRIVVYDTCSLLGTTGEKTHSTLQLICYVLPNYTPTLLLALSLPSTAPSLPQPTPLLPPPCHSPPPSSPLPATARPSPAPSLPQPSPPPAPSPPQPSLPPPPHRGAHNSRERLELYLYRYLLCPPLCPSLDTGRAPPPCLPVAGGFRADLARALR